MSKKLGIKCGKCGEVFNEEEERIYSDKHTWYVHTHCYNEKEDKITKFVMDNIYINTKYCDIDIYEFKMWLQDRTERGDILDDLWDLLISKDSNIYNSRYIPVKITIEFLEDNRDEL